MYGLRTRNMKEIGRGLNHMRGMSDPKQERDSDRESLTGWTLVDGEGTPEDATQEDPVSPPEGDDTEEGGEEEEEVGDGEESGCGMEEEEGEEEEEPLSDDLVTMGQRVQEIKGESIKASLIIRYQRISKKIPAFLVSVSNPLFCKEDGDVESLGSTTDCSLLDGEGKEKMVEEDTDLSLASSPSLPDDLPAIRPDTQYKHTPDRDLNSRLNVVVALTLACVVGLGLGHFLGLCGVSEDGDKGWSSRTMWQENLNSAQIIEALTTENENMETEMTRLQHEMIAPIKIVGKDGRLARELRERINMLILDNEELRMALGKLQFNAVPDADKEGFNTVLKNNYNLRIAVSKLRHLGPNLNDLKVSANDLQAENEELQIQVGKLRYQEQPLPQELNAVAREIENMKKTVREAYKQKKVPPALENARTYVTYMSQIIGGIQTLHEFGEGSFSEKVDVATDVFEGLLPGNVNLSPGVQQKMNVVRAKFNHIRGSLGKKWEKVKELSRPERIVSVGRETLSKMNRVIVNVVTKMKEIGQASIMNRGKTSIDKTITILADSFTALGAQFDKTWNTLEADTAKKEEPEDTVTEDATENEAPPTASAAATPQSVEDDDEGVEEKEEEEEDATTLEIATEEVEEVVEEPQQPPVESGRGDKRGGGDGGDKKKKPDDNKQKEGKKEKKNKKEEKKEEKQEAKHQRSRRNRLRSSEEKEEKKAQKKNKNGEQDKKSGNDKARQEKVKDDKKGKESAKHGKSKDKKEGKNKSHKRDKDRNIEEQDERYYKGQYNKYDKKRPQYYDNDDDVNDEDKSMNKHHKKSKHDDDDDDDKHRMKHRSKHEDNDDDDDERNEKRRQARRGDSDSDDKKKGLMRHWEKPSSKKVQFTGPKKDFIRRRDD